MPGFSPLSSLLNSMLGKYHFIQYKLSQVAHHCKHFHYLGEFPEMAKPILRNCHAVVQLTPSKIFTLLSSPPVGAQGAAGRTRATTLRMSGANNKPCPTTHLGMIYCSQRQKNFPYSLDVFRFQFEYFKPVKVSAWLLQVTLLSLSNLRKMSLKVGGRRQLYIRSTQLRSLIATAMVLGTLMALR
jgi:hypothetical protein